jgi:hypothetical protein
LRLFNGKAGVVAMFFVAAVISNALDRTLLFLAERWPLGGVHASWS